MAEKKRFLDVWIVESNTVYKEVPFNVVSDWVQQGRLLEDDKLRPSGTAEWFRVGGSPDFAPYLPKVEPFRAEDKAEALEPVHLDFGWKRRRPDEEEDVDMIPLIDVSLVLLIFFMMTASGVGASVLFPTPAADSGEVVDRPEGVWVGINLEPDGTTPIYMVGLGSKAPDPDDRDLSTKGDLLVRLEEILKKQKGPVELTINANPDVKAGLVRELSVALEREPFKKLIIHKYIGTSERTP